MIHEVVHNVYIGDIADVEHITEEEPDEYQILDVRGMVDKGNTPFQNLKNAKGLADVIDFYLKKRGKKVLVHCDAGLERSPLVVVIYLYMYHNMILDEAYKYVLEKRPGAFNRREWLPPDMELKV